MKTYVITLSHAFPKGHIRAGEATEFRHLLENGFNLTDDGLKECRHKIHTIRGNYPLWAKRIAEVERGEAALSVRQWSSKPYNSKQVEIARLGKDDGVGIQKIEFDDNSLYLSSIDGVYRANELLASNDGLSADDWRNWFKKTDLLAAYGDYSLH